MADPTHFLSVPQNCTPSAWATLGQVTLIVPVEVVESDSLNTEFVLV